MNRLTFPGVRKPLSNFEAVKTDLQTQLLMYEVDLSTARSLAANTAAELRFAGNALYIDKASDVGNASIIFQDDSRLKPARVYVEPGFIARVPWTRLMIENAAQAGKVLRIFYGVDVDFVPGTSAGVNITGVVDVALQPYSYGASYRSINAQAANTPETVFSGAANLNGAIVHELSFAHFNATALPIPAYLAKTSAPTTVIDGDGILSADSIFQGPNISCSGRLRAPVLIPPGKGLYYISDVAEVSCSRSCLYTLL